MRTYATPLRQQPIATRSTTGPSESASIAPVQAVRVDETHDAIARADKFGFKIGDIPMGHGSTHEGFPVQRRENSTGLPDALKSGVEGLSGMSMDHVRVHYNSPKPAQIQAHAYTQGAEIHVAPGQERHVPHEAWHVVQQAQRRVQPTAQLKGVGLNDDAGLEKEADTMGARAMQMKGLQSSGADVAKSIVGRDEHQFPFLSNASTQGTIQKMRWRRAGDDLVPLTEGYRGSMDVSKGMPDFHKIAEGDVWDDKTGNIFDANTGRLKHNTQTSHKDHHVLPTVFQDELTRIESTPHTKLESKQGVKDYVLKINKLVGAIDEWLWGEDSAPERPWRALPDPVDQSTALHEDGYHDAAKALLEKLEALKDMSILPEEAPKAPKSLGGKVALAHALAMQELASGLADPDYASGPAVDIKGIGKKADETETHRFTAAQTLMSPQGGGLNWWASGARGLAGVAQGSRNDNLIHVDVGGVRVPIAVKPPNKANPEGEFIVLGVDAPLVHNTEVGNEGIQTPMSADDRHRVSYPAFIAKLKTVHQAGLGNPLMNDAQIARAMLDMVHTPGAAPTSVLPSDMPIVAEALTTWMIAEPARHPSVIFNSVMALEQIALGPKTFEDFMKDAGEHPMSGGGTAKAGRTLRDHELDVLKGKDARDLTTMGAPGRRQVAMLSGEAGRNLTAPLERILRTYGGKNVKIRYLSNE